ncbi:MAG: fibronectin type III domain-containing protein [bacterium]
MKKLLPLCLTLSFFTNILAPLLPFAFTKQFAFAGTTVSVSGTAEFMNTGNYLDFTNYNSNVVIVGSTGNFEGYAWSADLGWVAFGTTDNSEGPVNVNTSTGAVTGKAKVLNTGAFIDFTNYNSNAVVNLSTGAFSGYAWSEDAGWVDFTSAGVSFSDTEAPSPDPATFSSAPAADSVSQISMTATAATDNGFGALEYYFDETSGGSGATDSGWQVSNSYSDSGLSVNTQYTYRVKSRDGVATPNETAYSSEVSAYTLANQPGTPTAASQDYSGTNGYWTKITIPATGGVPDDGNPAGTQYAVTIDGGTTWLTSSGGTSLTKSWSATYSDYWYHKNLSANTSYTYHLMARNGDSVETALSSSGITVTTAPAAPANLSAASITETTATISWDAASGADTYDLSYGTSPTATDTVATGIAGVSHALSSLTAGTKYYYKVRAVSTANGTGAYSSVSSFYTVGDITLTLTVDSLSQITASWTETGAGTAVSYHLERATASNYSDATEIYDGLSPREFVSESLSANTIYYFRVRAEFAGETYGAWNNSSDETLPSPPTALALTASFEEPNTNKLALSWTSPGAGEISSFKAFRGGDKDSGTLVATVANTTTTYTDTALDPNTSYTYYVYSLNSSGAFSVSYTTASEYTLSATPASIAVSGDYDSTNGYHADVSWTTGGGQKEYRLYRGGDRDTGTLVYSGTGTSYLDANLSANTAYAYYIYAVNEEDVFSPSYQFASDTTPLAQVTGVNYTPYANAITWEWTRVASATYYKVYNSTNDSLVATVSASDAGCAGSSSTCSFQETGLVSNTNYSRYIRAFSSYGLGQASLTISKYTLPSTPNSLIIGTNDYSDTDGYSLSLSWNSGGVQYGYKVFRGGDKDSGTLVTSSVITSASHKDTSLSANSTYTYYVYAVNPDGRYSDSISGRGYTPPGQPGGLTAVASSSKAEITWSWSTVSGANGYYVYDAAGTQIAKIESAFQTALTRTGLEWDKTYSLYVKAYNAYGQGPASATVAAKTPANPEADSAETADTEAPSAATSYHSFGLAFPAPSGIHLIITNFKVWGYAEPVSTVSVYHSTSAGENLVWEKLGQVQADGGGYFEFGQHYYAPGTHYFRITAKDAAGNVSAYSDTVTIYIDTPLEIPTDLDLIKERKDEIVIPVKDTVEDFSTNVGYFQRGLNEEFAQTLEPVGRNAGYFNKGLKEELAEFFAQDFLNLPRRFFLAMKEFGSVLLAKIELPKREAKEPFYKKWALGFEVAKNRISMAYFNAKTILKGEESLEITQVKIAAVSKDSITVTWSTNHYATSKVNYGRTLAYGDDVLDPTRVLDHEVVIVGLEPETTYYFEVISHNGTTAYDAYHIANTLPE